MELFVNNDHYSDEDFINKIKEIKNHYKSHNFENKIVSLCINNPFDLLAFITFLKDNNSSVFLIHSESPLEGALEQSKKVGASFLIYNDWHTLTELQEGQILADSYLLQMSSGTTNKPKIIKRTWMEIDKEIHSYNSSFPHSKEDQPIILVPVSHSYGLITGVLASVERGLIPKIITNKNPKYYIKTILESTHPLIYGIPFYFNLLESFKNNDIRYSKIVSSGAPLTQNILENLNKKSEFVMQQYGCTEVGCISFSIGTAESTDVGQPLKHLSVSIDLDEESKNNYGEIIVNYDNKKIETKDYGFLSESGSIHILNRMDDLINVSGQKVVPSEVESVILSITDISEAIVYRGYHTVWGECVKLVVTCKNDVPLSYIKSYCTKFLPKYKIPTDIKIIKNIPKTANGKISRKLILEKEKELI